MAAFIVISASEKLNWIVDDIERCRPLNPSVESHIGTGKLEKKKMDCTMYITTILSK